MRVEKRLMARLRSRAGESIGEVLAALLISALALVMLASMVSKSANLVTDSERNMNAYITAENKLAKRSAPDHAGKATLTMGGASRSINVQYYENVQIAGYPVVAYEVVK